MLSQNHITVHLTSNHELNRNLLDPTNWQ